MSLSDRFYAVVGQWSPEELRSWGDEIRERRKPLYDKLLSRKPGEACEWGLMDDPGHPLHDEWNDFHSQGGELPSETLMAPGGSNWQWIALHPHSVGSEELVLTDRRACPVLKHDNSSWDSTLRDLSRVGKPDGGDGGEFLRPQGEFVMDLVSMESGYELLNTAHWLAHEYDMSMLEGVATLQLCLMYGVPFLVDGRPGTEAFGIKVVASSEFRKPTGVVPVMSKGGMIPFKTRLVVFSGVYIEPHPKNYDDPTKFLEVNRWSCEPTMSVIAGFEYPDFIAKSPMAERFRGSTRNPNYIVPVPAMLPASELEKALALAFLEWTAEHKDWESLRYEFLDDWLKSGYKSAMALAPPLPCKRCLRLNTLAEGHPLRPRSRRPDNMKLAPPEVQAEWREYEEKMDRIFKILDRAAWYSEGRAVGYETARKSRRKRRAYHARKERLVQDIARLDRMKKQALARGNLDKASEYARGLAKRKKALEELLNTTP